MSDLFCNSEVMDEFFKIASKNPHQEDPKTIEEKVLEVEEDIIEDAHPDPVYVAEALGDGGLVENQNEQHDKMMAVVNKMPNGQYLHTYASCARDLLKLAEECEACGETDAAEVITILAEKVLNKLPFA